MVTVHFTCQVNLTEKGGDEMQESNLIENKVRYWRKKRGLTQDRLAELSGLSRVSISEIERGTADTKISTIKALAKALNVEFAEIFP